LFQQSVSPQLNLFFSTLTAETLGPNVNKKDEVIVDKKTRSGNNNDGSQDDVLVWANTIRHIKADLIEADINKDGRLQPEELKIILNKYSDVFTQEDITKLHDLFYYGKGGSSVSHEQFLDAISQMTTAKDKDEPANEIGLLHRRSTNKKHPLGIGQCVAEYMPGRSKIYSEEELDVKLTHVEPKTNTDKLAHAAVKVVRFCFDTVSLWKFGEITQAKVYRRVIFLETVAAIPGFVAAMVRHFKSLRSFSRDGGMLQMFLDEANNERMHLLTFVRMKDPSKLTRGLVLVSQTVIGAAFFILYNISPDFCHRFVGYVEEEACHTYTDIIQSIENAPDGSDMAKWRTELAPAIARGYWHLGEFGTVLDMMYAIRADEAEHRDVNHVCTGFREGQINPLFDPQAEFDKMLLSYVKNIMKREEKHSR
jgi:hypothetical protein